MKSIQWPASQTSIYNIYTQYTYTCTYITRIVLFLGHYVVDRQAIFNNPPYLAYLLASFCYSYVYIMWHCDIDVAINDIISIILSMQKLKTRCIHVQLKILAGGPCTGLARVGWRHGGTGHTFTEYVTLLDREHKFRHQYFRKQKLSFRVLDKY